DFKLNSKSHIIKEAIKQIETYNPDVILLDLRLCDDDFDNHIGVSELSGFKILEEVKKINRGIQVIITTASSKSKVYETVFKKGADYYILKQESQDTKTTINELYSTFKLAIDKASFLKPIHISFDKIELLGQNFSEIF